MREELGDCLWYMALAAAEFGVTLEEVAQQNLAKLAARQRAGTLSGNGDHR
jgi:NTP pyrophosphatase (non-canonical NTP hydrolase)